MNDQTAKLIEQLAAKLGTTTEYLWGVMLKQAPISSVTSIMQMACVVLFGIALWKSHKRLSKKGDEGDRYSETGYEKHDSLPLVMGSLTVIFGILVIACFLSIGDVVNGFVNPEFWALEHILNTCK